MTILYSQQLRSAFLACDDAKAEMGRAHRALMVWPETAVLAAESQKLFDDYNTFINKVHAIYTAQEALEAAQ